MYKMMLFIVVAVALAGSLAIAQDQPTTKGDADSGLLARFRKEYQTASEASEKAYARSMAVGTHTISRTGNLIWKTSVVMSRFDGSISYSDSAIESNNDRFPTGSTSAFGGNTDKFFDIYRLQGEKDFKVTSFGPMKDLKYYTRLTVPPQSPSYYLAMQPLSAAYSIQGERIVDLFADPKSILKSAQMDVLEKREVVRVEFTRELPKATLHEKASIQEGAIYFLLPGWEVAGWHSTARYLDTPADRTDHNLTVEGRVAYSVLNPIPKVSGIRTWRVRPHSTTDEVTDEIDRLEFLDAPKGKFQLQDFGVNEPRTYINEGEDVLKAK
jgi:hypothetical protein